MVARLAQATVGGRGGFGSRVASRQMRHIGLVCYFLCVLCFILFSNFIFHFTSVEDRRRQNADRCGGGGGMPLWRSEG